MLTPAQIRMARAALGWSTVKLAREAGITANTVTRVENGGNATIETLSKIKSAFEQAGVVWVPENGGAAGVRPPRIDPVLHNSSQSDSSVSSKR